MTTAGKLTWQNGLTALNAPFFDLSDALFVNYTWTPDKLPATTAAAGARAASVYMGVDVFGRGSYGGGGFGSKLALAAAVEAGLSAALFAPGWVRENLDKAKFHELQDQWWQQVIDEDHRPDIEADDDGSCTGFQPAWCQLPHLCYVFRFWCFSSP